MHLFNSKDQKNIEVSVWLSTLTIMTFVMIIIGGLTRLTDSGLSMVDWRPIMGTLPPLSPNAWIEAFNSYKSTPEFKIVNKSITLDEFKYIFWWEWFHRFFARCMGIVFLLPFVFFLYYKKISKNLFLALIFVFLFGMFQAVVGWWMVKSGLVDNPYVSAYRLTFHLINALIIYCILFWCSLNSIFGKNINLSIYFYIKYFFILSLFFIFITIISGGFMAGTNSGDSYNTYPLMNGELIPEGYFIKDYSYLNIFENSIAINFNHRWLASFTFIFILFSCIYFLISKKHNLDKKYIYIIIFFITLQFLLGVLTLLYSVPIIMASMHQTNSTLLLSVIIFSFHRYLYKKSKN